MLGRLEHQLHSSLMDLVFIPTELCGSFDSCIMSLASPPPPPLAQASLAQTLPPEVLVRIFEHLGDFTSPTLHQQFESQVTYPPSHDPRDVKPVCLVCQAWLAPAQSLLYRRVFLQTSTALIAFTSTLQTNEALRLYTRSTGFYRVGDDHEGGATPGAMQQLSAPLPNLEQILTLGMNIQFPGQSVHDKGATPGTMQQLFALLPNLEQIFILGMEVQEPAQSVFGRCCTQLKMISIIGMPGSGTSVHASILADLPKSLTHLCLKAIEVKGDHDAIQLPNLRHLRLEIRQPGLDTTGLKALAKCPMLDTLYLDISDPGSMREFLQELGPAVRKLYLDRSNLYQLSIPPPWFFPIWSKVTDLILIGTCWPREFLDFPSTINALTWKRAPYTQTLHKFLEELRDPYFLPNLEYLPWIELDRPTPSEQASLDQMLETVQKKRGFDLGSHSQSR